MESLALVDYKSIGIYTNHCKEKLDPSRNLGLRFQPEAALRSLRCRCCGSLCHLMRQPLALRMRVVTGCFLTLFVDVLLHLLPFLCTCARHGTPVVGDMLARCKRSGSQLRHRILGGIEASDCQQCSLSWAFDRWEEETPNRMRWDMGERKRLSD